MADKTVHLVPPQAWELAACAAASVTLSQLRFFIAFMLSVAAGAILRALPTVRGEAACRCALYWPLYAPVLLPGLPALLIAHPGARGPPLPAARHWFSLVSGVALIAYPFGAGCLHAFVPALLVYACMARWRARCGTIAWAVAFPYLILQ